MYSEITHIYIGLISIKICCYLSNVFHAKLFLCRSSFAAIEGSGMGGMKLPVGMTRRALSYDDNLEAPMSTPPHDISINNLWRRPVIPERKFSQLAEVKTEPVDPTSAEGGVEKIQLSVVPSPPGGRERPGQRVSGAGHRLLQGSRSSEDQGLLHHHEFSHHQYVSAPLPQDFWKIRGKKLIGNSGLELILIYVEFILIMIFPVLVFSC